MRGTALELATRFSEPPKGEVTLVIGPSGASAGPTTRRPSRLLPSSSLPAHRARVAVDVVARLTGSSRNTLYRASL